MFEGWLIKCNDVEIPMEYMRLESYTVTPNQRMDLSAERDMTGVLHRDTVSHMPVKIEFETPYMYSRDVALLNSVIQAAFTDRLGRTLDIEYYDPEEDTYKTATCYMPDTNYNIYNVDIARKTILYSPMRYAFIEY